MRFIICFFFFISRCNAFNPFGDSNANIDLNFDTGSEEQNGAEAAAAAEQNGQEAKAVAAASAEQTNGAAAVAAGQCHSSYMYQNI